MTLDECIIEAASMLNLDDVLTEPTLSETDKLLVKCANRCLDEIVTEYLPYEKEKEVESADGKIKYCLLDRDVYDISGVYDERGKVKYRLMPAYLEVERDGKYTVRYSAKLPPLTIGDEIPVQLRLTERIVAYGIATEYLLSSGFYDEAVTYDQRFKDALKRVAYGSGEKRIKTRRWLL